MERICRTSIGKIPFAWLLYFCNLSGSTSKLHTQPQFLQAVAEITFTEKEVIAPLGKKPTKLVPVIHPFTKS